MLKFLFSVVISFYIVHAAIALSILRTLGQQPLSPVNSNAASDLSRPSLKDARVILGVTALGSSEERYVEFPLRERISAGPDFSHYLNSAKLIALVNPNQQAAPLEQLGRITCTVIPAFSVKERTGFESMGVDEPDWPAFMLEDGAVRFQEPESMWFLAGRAIESFECR